MKAKKQKPIDNKKFRTNRSTPLTSTVKNDQRNVTLSKTADQPNR